MKICFVHAADFFFTKKLIILSLLVVFLLLFFTDVSLQNDYLVENNGFLVAKNPAAVALIGGKEFFSVGLNILVSRKISLP